MRAARVPGGLLIVLGYASMSAALATDLVLPGLPEAARAFDVKPATAQLVLTGFMVGLAIGNLFVGSLSDALGRRRTLLVGLGLSAVCALAAGFSPSIEVLIVVRALQGFGAASGAVLARAIIADLSDAAETSRAFALLFVMIGLGPTIAMPFGAWLSELSGWRAAMVALGVLSAGMWIAALLRVPETLPPAQRHPFRVGVLAANLWFLLRKRAFRGFVVAFAAGYSAMIVYIGSSAFIAQEFFGLRPIVYAFTFVLGSLSFVGGAWVSGMLGARFTTRAVLRGAQLLQCVTSAMALLLALAGVFVLPLYVVMIVLLMCSSGAVMSITSALTVRQAVGVAGAGSALLGFAQFVFGAAATPLGGLWGSSTVIPMTFAMTVFAVVSLLAVSFAERERALRSRAD